MDLDWIVKHLPQKATVKVREGVTAEVAFGYACFKENENDVLECVIMRDGVRAGAIRYRAGEKTVRDHTQREGNLHAARLHGGTGFEVAEISLCFWQALQQKFDVLDVAVLNAYADEGTLLYKGTIALGFTQGDSCRARHLQYCKATD